MSNTQTDAAIAAPKADPALAGTKKPKNKKNWPSKLPNGGAKKADEAILSGHVTRIAIRPKAANVEPVVIEIANKKGGRQSYDLDSSDPARHAAMLQLAAAAFSARSKLHVETADGPDGTKLAAGLELKSKR